MKPLRLSSPPRTGTQLNVITGYFTQTSAYSYQCKAGSVLMPKNAVAYKHLQGVEPFSVVNIVKGVDNSLQFCCLYVYKDAGVWYYGKCTYISDRWVTSYTKGTCTTSTSVRVTENSSGVTVAWDEFYTSGWSGSTGTRNYTWQAFIQ